MVATGDFNADGISDLVAAHDSAVAVFFGKSDGTFLPGVNLPAGISPSSIRVADFNRDGKPDILTGDSTYVGPSVLLNTMPDACFACTNPTTHDGSLCSDGNVCTTGDSCQNHLCVGGDVTDGISCSTRTNASGSCTVGTCHDTCNPGYADCGGICTGIVSDNQNCGGCGIPCSSGTTCASGKCVMTEILRSCSTTSPVTILVKGSNATAYVANGHWHAYSIPEQDQGVQVIPLEGGGSPVAISTPSMVNVARARMSRSSS